MSHTFVINPGSSSIKFAIFDADIKEVLRGHIDMNGDAYACTINALGEESCIKITHTLDRPTHVLFQYLGKYPISKIGFRVVFGGEEFVGPVKITHNSLFHLESLSHLAPLHNPPTLAVMREFLTYAGKIPMYGVFDTDFHRTMKEEARTYALPHTLAKTHSIKRFGYHGTSYRYVLSEIKKLYPAEPKDKIIIAHLGAGASLAAIQGEKCIDTSMGFTPLEGIPMATRSGDIDPSIILYLAEKGMSLPEISDMLHKKSGLLGMSGVSGDMRELLKSENIKKKEVLLAISNYTYRIRKMIGAYAAALGGVDVVAFTGGVGCGDPRIREAVLMNMDFLRLHVDHDKNKEEEVIRKTADISTIDSLPILVIPTNEELQIARDIKEL